MKKRVSHHPVNHKNLTRLDYIRGFNPIAGEKLRQMLEENRAKEKDSEQR